MSTVPCNGEICFFCRKPIHVNGIEWEEQNNWRDNPKGENLVKIRLHPECSVQLGIRLIRDGLPLTDDNARWRDTVNVNLHLTNS